MPLLEAGLYQDDAGISLKSDDSAAPRRYGRGSRQLFLDAEDTVLASAYGTSITMHPIHFPADVQPVLTATEPWEGNRLGYYNSAVDNGSHVLLYYSTFNTLFQGGMVTCLAVSSDRGRRFTKPSLGLSLFNRARGSWERSI